MKQFLLLCLTPLLLFLTGCHQDSPEPETPPAPPIQEEAIPEETGRDSESQLIYFLEGEEVQEPAHLYTGEGWSIYIPTQGWNESATTVDAFSAVTWTPAVNDSVDLRILNLGTMSLENAQKWVIAQHPDYDLILDKQGGVSGTDSAQNLLDARLIAGANTMYALLTRYPMDAAEGFGVTLRVITDTFEPAA